MLFRCEKPVPMSIIIFIFLLQKLVLEDIILEIKFILEIKSGTYSKLINKTISKL